MIKNFYTDKTLLLTGGTGFLGKVILEKFIRDLPQVKKIYILVRPKRGTPIKDRLMREIVQSPCFDNIRDLPQFNQMLSEKIIPVEGDINKDGLALKPEDREVLISELDVIMNCAASVDFNEQITDAINVNYMGCMRMLELAHQCQKLQIFTHVSTAYVNCEKKGFIKEQIYDIDGDSEQIINSILKMSRKEQEEKLSQILGPWPNTYTFTKSMAERTLRKRRNPNLPCLLVRPSIIIGAIKEPHPGWTDTISAAGGLSLVGGIGMVNWIHGSKDYVADLVPVDIVSNMIISATAVHANQPFLRIVHSNSSHRQPLTWGGFKKHNFEYLSHHPYDMQIFKPDVYFVGNEKLFKTLFYLRSELPVKAMEAVSKIPGLGAGLRKSVSKGKMLNARAIEIGQLFEHFTTNQWIFENKFVEELNALISPQEQELFYYDPKVINWSIAIKLYIHGIQRFCLKQQSVAPDNKTTALIRKNDFFYFQDLKWAFFNGKPILSQDLNQIRRDVMNSSILQEQIQAEVKKIAAKQIGNKQGHSDSEIYNKLLSQASKHLKDIEASLRPSVVRSSLWVFQKIWQKVYDQIIVNESQLAEIRDLLNSKTSNVILVPTHKSYMDSILLGYIHYHFKLEYPFVCGSEAFFTLALISYIMKATNGFYFDANNMKDQVYQAVIQAYIWALMKHNCLIEVFLEKIRSRSGKICSPSEILFDQIIKIQQQNKESRDIKFVPITINYDRVHDGESFPLELLGEAPQRDGIYKILQHFIAINKPLGRVVIKYCDPISLDQFTKQHAQKNNQPIDVYQKDENSMKALIKDLGKEICLVQSDNLVVMSTPLVATILLMHRRGISHDLLIKRVTWVYEEIRARKGEISLTAAPSGTLVTQCLNFLSGFVKQKRDVFEPSVQAKKGDKSILMLTYYRNNLIHHFVNEAIVANAILGLSNITNINQGISINAIWEKVQCLRNMLGNEFLIRRTLNTQNDVLTILKFWASRGQIRLDEQNQNVSIDTKDEIQNYTQSFLYHMLLPIVESYWLTLTYFLSYDNRNNAHDEDTLYNKIQWLIETLYASGQVKFYESCMLQSIKNAVKQFLDMGILIKQEVPQKKNQKKIFYQLSDNYKKDEDKIAEAYEQVIFFLPYSPSMSMNKMFAEIRKLFVSEILVGDGASLTLAKL